MTTKRDIIFEQITDTLIRLKNQGLLSERQYEVLKQDWGYQLDAVIENENANSEQITWNIQTSI